MKVNFDLNETLDYIELQQTKLITGIPFGFNRYKEALSSIERGDYHLIVAGQGGGKSSYAIDKYLINSILYSYSNPGLINLHIDYFNLEETDERFNLKILSNIIYRILGKEFSVNDFQNRGGKKLLLNNTFQFKVLQPFIDHYNSHVSLYNDKSPIMIKKRILESSNILKRKGWDLNASNYYHIVIVDNLKFLKRDNGERSAKEAIDSLCLGVLQELRQTFAVIPVILQHQSGDNNDMIINVKGDIIENKLKPSLMNLGESKYTADVVNLAVGLWNPHRHSIATSPKGMYDISKLQNNFRSIIPLKCRDSGFEQTELPLYFKGNVSAFEELPKFEDFQKNPGLYNQYGVPLPTQPVRPTLTFTGLNS